MNRPETTITSIETGGPLSCMEYDDESEKIHSRATSGFLPCMEVAIEDFPELCSEDYFLTVVIYPYI